MTEQTECPWSVEFRNDESAVLDHAVVTSQSEAWRTIQQRLPGVRARHSGTITVVATSRDGETYRGTCEVDGSFAWEPAREAPRPPSAPPGIGDSL